MAVMFRVLLISLTWVVFQIGSGYVTNRLPTAIFHRSGLLFRTGAWEREGMIYATLFGIRRWKNRMPEAGAMFRGGFSKARISVLSRDGLERFVAETRRAELTHWLPFLLSFSFFAWNPIHVAIWMPLVGLLGNAPFIMIQRYLRPRLQRLIDARSEDR